ncbi:MAG: Uma2 family endonuclease [Polyangiaceae bacterium]|nr:Uma2 family endonuclease [Myxococcales bacterium]MCB9588065.1 Uma2 family endonuclease [Polyangiaceae bacterium]
MVNPAPRMATYADLEALPEHLVGEIIDGELIASPFGGSLHARAATVLGAELGRAFCRGRGGPGGWLNLNKPELHLSGNVLVPDLAGWRRTTLPELPDAPCVSLRPDWVCEVLSPSTAVLDRRRKLPIYAHEGVGHVWLVDPKSQLLEIFRLDGETYRAVASYAEDEKIRAEPFDAIELELAALWAR